MAIEMPVLPYAREALEPHVSAETIDYHFGKHHRGYVTKLNEQIAGTEFEAHDLLSIVRTSRGGMFNCAAQAWNHDFYWNCLGPNGGGEPTGKLADAIRTAFGGFAQLQEQFTQTCTDLFGSGWVWLVQRADGGLGLAATFNANTPATGNDRALLTCDVWEHAYYIDHRNARAAYVAAFWKLVRWDLAAARLA